jgi:hypothetical protein
LLFGVLAVAALVYRYQPETHKSLMLFANIKLMSAPLAHILGHNPTLAALPGVGQRLMDHPSISLSSFVRRGAPGWADRSAVCGST